MNRLAAPFLILPLAGCAAPRVETSEDKRACVRRMRDEALEALCRGRPELRSGVEKAAGYGFFSTVGIKVPLVEGGHGYGLVTDNGTGRETYTRMAQVGVRFGYGLDDFRAVFVFKDRGMLETFVEKGWDFGWSAETWLVADESGASAGGQTPDGAAGSAAAGGGANGVAGKAGESQESLGHPIDVYVFTRKGIILKHRVAGMKCWKDGVLNAP